MCRCATPDQQRAEDLPERLCVQAVAGLRLGELGQVGEEVLQGEAVVQGYRGGVLQNQAHLSVLAFTQSAIWKRVFRRFRSALDAHTNATVGPTQNAENVWEPESVQNSRVKVRLCVHDFHLNYYS